MIGDEGAFKGLAWFIERYFTQADVSSVARSLGLFEFADKKELAPQVAELIIAAVASGQRADAKEIQTRMRSYADRELMKGALDDLGLKAGSGASTGMFDLAFAWCLKTDLEQRFNERASLIMRDEVAPRVVDNADFPGGEIVATKKKKATRRLPKGRAPKKSDKDGPDPKKVFVIHGRDHSLRKGLFTFLRALELQPIEWDKAKSWTGKGSPHISDVIDAGLARAQCAIALFSGDDVVQLREDLRSEGEEPAPTHQPRPNVIFEAGMVWGSPNRDRLIIVEAGKLRGLSDLDGVHTIRISNKPDKRQSLINALRTCGCDIELANHDWQTEGSLEPEVPKKNPPKARRRR